MFSIIRRSQPISQCLRIIRPVEKISINKYYSTDGPTAIRRTKSKTKNAGPQNFVDLRQIRAIGGNGGDGCISFLQLWVNENAGPDGGDGGNGGHVVLQASVDVNNLVQVKTVLHAENGKDGRTKDRHGKNADHLIVKVPIGTVIRDLEGMVIGDLNEEGAMFICARGGAGGKGNHFFCSNAEQAPQVCEYGAKGEEKIYVAELRSMANIGLIGLPNAGKSTLLRAITRAKPKVAPYAFTTLQPQLGMVHYDDYEQISIADLPGLIPGSHQNRGLGIQFLKHAERCKALLFIIDVSCEEPWNHFETLKFELTQFSEELANRPQVIVANKIDLPAAEENLDELREMYDIPIIPISAKMGTNINTLLSDIRKLYDKFNKNQRKIDKKGKILF